MRSSIFKPGTDAEFVSVQDGYDRWATLYDAEDNPLIALEEPRVDALLGDVTGREVLELGSGTGRHTLRLVARGALVTALEISAEMAARAAAKPGWGAVRFVRHDLTEPLPLADAAFDVVCSFLVLEHIADLRAFFAECKRVCRPTGRIAMTTLHPAMLLRGIQAHFRDPESGRDVCPQSCPHQISDYVLAAVRSGLHIQTLGEHSVDADLARRSARAAKYEGWPMLFTMGLRPAGAAADGS